MGCEKVKIEPLEEKGNISQVGGQSKIVLLFHCL